MSCKSDLVFRGRRNRAKGLRFERKIARLLRAAGFDARRILEYDGYSHGCDIALRRPGEQDLLPVAIQCKATKDPRDAARGLKQAMDGWRGGAFGYFCFHSYTPKGSRRAVIVAVGHSSYWDMPTSTYVFSSYKAAIALLQRAYLPKKLPLGTAV